MISTPPIAMLMSLTSEKMIVAILSSIIGDGQINDSAQYPKRLNQAESREVGLGKSGRPTGN